MTIAVFGGSFNPPHKGHLAAALAASRQLKPDEFLVIPDFQPPHKQLAEGSPEQLRLCAKYGIIPDELERENGKLLHAKTGAAVAKFEFGSDDEVVEAIRWHTTGRPNMTTLEKVLYMADYMEPTRDFPGVEELRRLAYEDLDRAMVLGFEMSLEDILSRGETPHKNTLAALQWYQNRE